MAAAARFVVSGRVQGVSFRAYTQGKARELGLAGHARNLPDGRVEVVAEGAPAAIDALGEWLWQGSPAARVSGVERETVATASRTRFDTG